MNKRAELRHPGRHARRDIAIGYIRPFTVDGHFLDSLFSICMHDRDHGQRIWDRIAIESGARLAAARNNVVREFLKTDAQALQWFDADMVLPAETIDVLAEHLDPVERPIVAGLYFLGGRTKVTPAIYTMGHNDDGKIESTAILKYPRSALIEVGGTGGGCMLVHRSVYERILENMPADYPLPWYQDQIIDGHDWGEDLVFCLRARAAGARIWMHTGLKLGHRKMFTMDEDTYLEWAARADAILDAMEDPEARTYADLPDLAVVQ